MAYVLREYRRLDGMANCGSSLGLGVAKAVTAIVRFASEVPVWRS